MSTPTGTPPQYSDDGKWWWDGHQWLSVTPQPQQQVPPQQYAAAPQQQVPAQGGPVPYGYPTSAFTGQGMAPPATGSDGKAVASLVLGIVWIGGLGSIIAVILGHISRSAARKEGRQPSGVALAGVILGYIGIAGIALIILLSTVAFHTVKSASQQLIVKDDLRNASVAEEVFYVDHETYTDTVSDLQQYGFHSDIDVAVAVISADRNAYCLVASRADGTDRFYYSSVQDGISTTPCS